MRYILTNLKKFVKFTILYDNKQILMIFFPSTLLIIPQNKKKEKFNYFLFFAFVFEQESQFGGCGCFTAAVETAHHDDIGLCTIQKRGFRFTHQLNKFIMNDFDRHLTG